jgi:4-hydroxy-tetrahydrodipicolinate synthase
LSILILEIIFIRSAKSIIITDMKSANRVKGVIAAAVTPLSEDFSPQLESVPEYLEFLHNRGCHGALLLGTTGEGPSFSPSERHAILKLALEVQAVIPDFILLAGTGTPSLDETIQLTRQAFELGFDGVVVLPPYYFRKVTEDGLMGWYGNVIEHAVPKKSKLYGYNIPQVSGVPLTINLLARLLDAYPERFAGIKNSSPDLDFTRELGERFGSDLEVFCGNDSLFSQALGSSAVGCITALANLCSPDSRQLWEHYIKSEPTEFIQDKLIESRGLIDSYPPAPPLIKFILSQYYGFPQWTVRPPLIPVDSSLAKKIIPDAESVLDI